MEQTKEQLQQQISETTQSLKAKIEKLEDSTLEAVETVTSGVKETAETIQKGLRNMSLNYHIEKHPAAVVAASVGLGAAIGFITKRRKHRSTERAPSAPQGPSLRQTVASALFTEISRNVAPTLVNFAMDKASDWAQKQITKIQEKYEEEKTASKHQKSSSKA